jgi:hypothetical protein
VVDILEAQQTCSRLEPRAYEAALLHSGSARRKKGRERRRERRRREEEGQGQASSWLSSSSKWDEEVGTRRNEVR